MPPNADFIGTKGNHRYALGIERDLKSVNLSDGSVIDDIYTDIQECVSTLRRRDLIKASMIHTLQQCTSYLRYVMAQCSTPFQITITYFIFIFHYLLFCIFLSSFFNFYSVIQLSISIRLNQFFLLMILVRL